MNPAQQERFRQRVLGARRLWRSVEERGFDTSTPIGLFEVEPPTRTDTGAPVSARYHLADGCHRAALMLRMGRALEPSMYRLRSSGAPVLDNTARLVGPLGVSDAGYAAFIAPAFTAEQPGSLAELRQAVAAAAPSRASELAAVLTAHGR